MFKVNTEAEDRLIAAAMEGDQDAFGQIVTKYERLVYNTIRAKVKSNEDAMDLSQEVFIKLWRSMKKYRGDCRFSTWIYKISVNASLDFLRRAQNKNETLSTHIDDDGEDKELELPDDSITASPERTLEKNETARRVRDAIERLSPEQREIVLLRDIEGYAYEEIAEMLSLEIGTVKSRLNRARANLRELLVSAQL